MAGATRSLEAKLKGDAAKNQADQHQGQGDRQGVDDHRVGEGKGAKQAAPPSTSQVSLPSHTARRC